jgi:hypothetical protein
VVYENPLQAPPRFQFEPNSGSLYQSQVYNCGPSCVTFIAGFYNDTWYQIETTRRNVTGCCDPTTAHEQQQMLIARGVMADVVAIESLAELDERLAGGMRPLIMGIQMSRVPAFVRDHNFTGWHAVTILRKGRNAAGKSGYIVMDPNFSPPGGYRPDPDKGHKFYSREVMYYAVMQNFQQWAIVPRFPKRLTRWAVVEPKDPLCRAPRLSAKINQPHNRFELLIKNVIKGGPYTYANGTRRSSLWIRGRRGDNLRFVPYHRVEIVEHA